MSDSVQEETVKFPRMLELAYRESEKSTYRHRIGVIISKGKRIISRGHNEVRHKAIGSSKYTEWSTSLHAERMACAAIPREELKGATIWIARQYSNGGWALSFPCEQCRRLIEDMQIKRIVYTIPEYPYFETLKLK